MVSYYLFGIFKRWTKKSKTFKKYNNLQDSMKTKLMLPTKKVHFTNQDITFYKLRNIFHYVLIMAQAYVPLADFDSFFFLFRLFGFIVPKTLN